MAKYMPGCLANNKVIIAQTFIYISCTLGFFIQINSLCSKSGPDEPAGFLLAALGFITCSLGLYGAYHRDPLILRTFAALVVFMNLVAILFAYRLFLHDAIKTETASKWHRDLDRYDWRRAHVNITQINARMTDLEKLEVWTHGPANEKWDSIQEELKCCGISGYSDWNKSRPKEVVRSILPLSCCPPTVRLSNADPCYIMEAFKIGCLDQYVSVQHMIGMTMIIATIVNTILTTLACYLAMQRNTQSPIDLPPKFDRV